MAEQTKDQKSTRAKANASVPLRLNSHDLFRHSDRLQIEHRGEIYRLQITRQGKLILTK